MADRPVAGHAHTRRAAALAGVLLAGPALTAPEARAADCQVALVLAHDVSSSVSAFEYALQTMGHAEGFRDPEVQQEILAMGEIQVMVIHWSADYYQRRRTPWRALRGLGDIEAFAAEAEALRREHDEGATAIGDMLGFLDGAWSEEGPAQCRRRIVDVSGDGASNSGRPLGPLRAQLLAQQVTINGLVFEKNEPEEKPPLAHYKRHVIGGPGAFVIKVDKLEDYGGAFRRKLLRELRGPPLAQGPRLDDGMAPRRVN